MSTLAESIRGYYYKNFESLDADKQFHFSSRLSAWDADKLAITKLENLRHIIVTADIRQDLKKILNNPPTAKINAAQRRAPYFEKYPSLRGRMLALFRVRHLLFHYNIDARPELLALVSKSEFYDLSNQLKSDADALSVLSTYAINYIYLVESILFQQDSTTIIDFLDQTLAMSTAYSENSEDSLLLIYLFTHCIIGASNFYQQQVPEFERPYYIKMLGILEQRIEAHFEDINLDNKFEFLVCCKIVGFETNLTQRIDQEAHLSLSSDGVFLIDTINNAGQNNKLSYNDSEHRNVLYIMSQSNYAALLSLNK